MWSKEYSSTSSVPECGDEAVVVERLERLTEHEDDALVRINEVRLKRVQRTPAERVLALLDVRESVVDAKDE